jgi:preprotein translocase subunit Sss1
VYKNEYDTYLEEVALEVDGLIVGNPQVKDHFVEQVDELLTMVTQDQTPDPILWFSWNPAFSTVQRKPNKQEYLMCQYVRLAVIHDAICSPVEDAQIFNEDLVSRYGRWQVYNNVFVRLECAIRCNPFFPDCSWYDTQRRLVAESLGAVKRDLLQQGLLQNEVKLPTAVEETALVEVKSNLARTKQNGEKVKGMEQKILQPGISLNADIINVEQLVQSEIASLQSTHTIYNHVPEKKPWYKTIWAAIGGIILLLGGLGTVIQIRESGTFKQLVASLNKPQSTSDPNAQTESNDITLSSKTNHDTSNSLPDLNLLPPESPK